MQITIIDYINQVRIENAMRLLDETHMKTYEVSEAVGFTDESYFSRIFKKVTGVRPTEYKKKDIAYPKLIPQNGKVYENH